MLSKEFQHTESDFGKSFATLPTSTVDQVHSSTDMNLLIPEVSSSIFTESPHAIIHAADSLNRLVPSQEQS